MKLKYTYFLFGLLALTFSAPALYAQDNNTTKEEPPVKLRSDELLFRDSLLMTPQDDIAINQALKGTQTSKAVSSNTAKREIRLAGLSYEGPNEWVLWLNNQRLVPGAVLPEIVELEVYPDFVHLKWFDHVSNEIIVIRLRPNQVYDIQSKILLPG